MEQGERQECGFQSEPKTLNKEGRHPTPHPQGAGGHISTGRPHQADHRSSVLIGCRPSFAPRCCLAYPSARLLLQYVWIITLILTDSTVLPGSTNNSRTVILQLGTPVSFRTSILKLSDTKTLRRLIDMKRRKGIRGHGAVRLRNQAGRTAIGRVSAELLIDSSSSYRGGAMRRSQVSRLCHLGQC